MIVCLCHRVSDRDIRRAVREGTTSFEVLQDQSHIASSCGCCHDCARAVFDEACAEQEACASCHSRSIGTGVSLSASA